MSYCLNPNCPKPQNPTGTTFCLTCGAKILLKDRYRATNFLAAGGMGKNFLAVDEDTPLKKRCVIKQFSPDSSIVNNPTAFQKAIELFNREAAMLDTLGDESPQIPRLLAYLEQDQCLYFVQEFIEGHNLLKELAQKGTYNEAQIYQLLNDLLPVLKFIHQQDVIHRDIKPENIMRRPNGELVLIDFGISKQFSGTLISMGTSVGTLGYAPPEQMTYGEAYPASDIYALGATCIHLLTDVSPDQLFNVRENCWLWRDVLATKGIYISQQLGQILDKMLITDVRERYQSVDEILVILAHTRQWRSKSHVSWYCRYTLMEHSEAVRAVVISPDGQTLVTGSDDKTIKIWNLSNGKLLGTLNGHNNWIYALAISPDGNTLVSGSGSILGHHQIIKVWNLQTKQEIRSLTGHSSAVRALAISPDGQTLVSGSDDKTIKIWNLRNGKLLGTLNGHNNWIYALAISPDGNTLVSGSGSILGYHQIIKVWNLKTKQEIRSLTGHSCGVRALAISPDSQTLFSGSVDTSIKIWNLSNGKLLGTLNGHNNWIYALAISPDGNTLVSGSGSILGHHQIIKVWNLKTKQEIRSLTGHSSTVRALAISSDGQTLVTGSDDKTIKIWLCD